MTTEIAPLAGRNIVVWDAEIKATIGVNGVGWGDKDKMGISVAVAFDFRSMDYLIFMDDNLKKLAERLNEADLVVGFNIDDFDMPLLNATIPGHLRSDVRTYDLLKYSRMTTGWMPGSRAFPRGLKLDDHLEGTFGRDGMKTANGSEAPIMWQEKRLGELITYCTRDTKCEAKLFQHVWAGKPVKTATHGEKFLEHPNKVLLSFGKQAELPLGVA